MCWAIRLIICIFTVYFEILFFDTNLHHQGGVVTSKLWALLNLAHWDTSFGTLQSLIRHTVMELLTVDQNSNGRMNGWMDRQTNGWTQAPFNIDRWWAFLAVFWKICTAYRLSLKPLVWEKRSFYKKCAHICMYKVL